MTGTVVRSIWEPVRIVETILPPYYVIAVVDESVGVTEGVSTWGGSRVAVFREEVTLSELRTFDGGTRVVVFNAPVYVPESLGRAGVIIKVLSEPVAIVEELPAQSLTLTERDYRNSRDDDKVSNILTLLAEFGPVAEGDVDAPIMYAFAAPAARRAAFHGAVVRQWVDGEQAHDYGVIESPSVMGSVLAEDFKPATAGVWDEASTVDVRVSSGEIASATDDEVLAGENRVYLNGEVFGFRTATQLDNTDDYRLSGLLRGLYGTTIGAAAGGHQWALVSGPRAALRVPWGDLDVETTFAVIPAPFSEPEEIEKITHTPQGLNLRPYAVADVAGTKETSNDWTVTWNRTSRMPHQRILSPRGVVDVDPMTFKVEILTSPTDPTIKRTIPVDGTESATYSLAQQTADFGGSQSSVTVNVYRYNDWGDGQGNSATLTA